MAENQTHTIKLEIDRSQAAAADAAEIQAAAQVAAAHDSGTKATGRAHDQASRARRQQVGEILSAEHRAVAARNEMHRDSTGRFVAGAKSQADASGAATRSIVGGMDSGRISAAGLLSGISGVSYALSGISSVAGVLQMIATRFDNARAASEKAGESSRAYLEVLRQLNNLEGGTGPDKGMVRAQVALRRETLQTRSEATEVQESINNQLGSLTDRDGKELLISAPEVKNLAKITGRMQARLNVAPGAIGKLSGMAAQMTGLDRVTGDIAGRELAQELAIMDKGGSDPTPAADSLAQNSSMVGPGGGQLKTGRDLAALTAVFSVGRSSTMTTDMQSLQRSLVAGLADKNVMPGAKMSQADYLKGIGIGDQTDLKTAANLFNADIEKAEAEAKGRGESLNMTTYLADRGINNVHDRSAMAHFYRGRRGLRETFDPMSRDLPTLDTENAKFAEFAGKDIGQARLDDVNDDEVEIERSEVAMKRKSRLKRAYHGLRREGVTDQAFDDVKESRMVRERALEDIRKEGLAENLDWKIREVNTGRSVTRVDPLDQFNRGRGLLSGFVGTYADSQAEGFADADKAIEAARAARLGGGAAGNGGGAPAGEAGGALTKEAVDVLKDIRRQTSPNAAPVQVKGGQVGPVR